MKETKKKFKAKPINDQIYQKNLDEIEQEKLNRRINIYSEVKNKHDNYKELVVNVQRSKEVEEEEIEEPIK